MGATPARSFTLLAAAIVVTALVVGGAFLTSSSFLRTTTSTTTATGTTTVTSTSISTQTVTSLGTGVTSTVTETSTSTVTSTVTSTSVSTVTSTYQPFVAPLLRVELNTSHVGYHGGLSATITLTNLLPYNISFVPALPANSSIGRWDRSDFLCGDSGYSDLFGFAVMKGHYSSANLSSAAPLTMEPPLVIGCPASTAPDKIVFLPNGSRYAVYYPPNPGFDMNGTSTAVMHPSTGDCVLLPAGYVSCDNGSLFGYWTWNSSSGPPYFNSQDANTTSKYFNYFPPGEYTLVVQDIWGATLFSYFQVATAPP